MSVEGGMSFRGVIYLFLELVFGLVANLYFHNTFIKIGISLIILFWIMDTYSQYRWLR